MIDDFTAEYRRGRAPLAAVVDRLDDLRDLGVTAIEFMPWTAWKNQEFDWGYEPFQYFAVEARYANDLDQAGREALLAEAADQRLPRPRHPRDHGWRLQPRQLRLPLPAALSGPDRLPVHRKVVRWRRSPACRT